MIGGKCCSPTSYEDCTCFRKDCPDENQELDPGIFIVWQYPWKKMLTFNMNVIDYITITWNLRNGRLQITSDYMKKCNRLQLITITPCLLPRKGWRYNKSIYNKVFKVRPCSGTDWLLNVNIFFTFHPFYLFCFN
jgi:hypothetical protein